MPGTSNHSGKFIEIEIENVPVIRCPHCGESYLAAATLHQIELIKRDRHGLAVARPVEVASLAIGEFGSGENGPA